MTQEVRQVRRHRLNVDKNQTDKVILSDLHTGRERLIRTRLIRSST